jgi:hypothetical protein
MSRYYIMDGTAETNIVLMNSLDEPSPVDDWMLGKKFTGVVKTPVEVQAKEDFDWGVLMAIYQAPTIMRRDLYEALCSAGVDNIDVWPAIIRKADGSVLSEDFLAFNVLGTVSAAGPNTVYAPENPSRMVDASIESLDIDNHAAKNLLLFRLAESIDLIVVHHAVKAAVEARGIDRVTFIEPSDALSL